MDKLAKSLGIENLSRSQVSDMTKGLNEQVQSFRERPLAGEAYPVLWVDAQHEKVRYGGRVVSMAIQIVCGVNAQERSEVLAIEPMLEESKDTYQQLFEGLKKRGLQMPSLVVSDAHKGLIAAIRTSFAGASWQRCKVHFMRNILAHIPHRDKAEFAGQLKEIWLAPSAEGQKSVLRSCVRSMQPNTPRRLKRWRTDWRIPFPSTPSRCSMPARSPLQTCWNGSTKRYGGEQGLLVSSTTLTYICAWSPRFSWNMLNIGRFSEPISAKNPSYPVASIGLIHTRSTSKLRTCFDTIAGKLTQW